MDAARLIHDGARAIAALGPALSGLEQMTEELAETRRAARRGYFEPAEEERLWSWFARYLTAQSSLLETIDDLAPIATTPSRVDDDLALRAFAVAYGAACLLVQAGRFLVTEFAADPVVQRKLDQAEPLHRIPAKQYTAIYKSLTSPRNAWRLYDARRVAADCREAIDLLTREPLFAPVVAQLRAAEPALRVEVQRYARARLRYRLHSWHRRKTSAVQQGIFGVMEAFGRVIADLRSPHAKAVGPPVLAQLEELIAPGDVIITRHDGALSNLFLPGYWPHAALYLGPARVRETLGIAVGDDRAHRWVDPLRVLEARKDGVLLRALDDTLSVDAMTVIRPMLDSRLIAEGLRRALSHEGKLYNFDFDFFRSDRLVCTEVVYRAFDGLGDLTMPLTRRAGRLTLSAEDLLDLAVDGRGFRAVAVFGTPSIGRNLVTGEQARDALRSSYRPEPD